MAIIGKLHSLGSLFGKTQDLQALYTYLDNAITPAHAIYERICSTPLGAENKFDLGGGMFCIEQTYALKDPNDAFYESHQEYIDFQLMVSGVEFFAIGDPADFAIKSPYDPKKDLIVYEKSLQTSIIRLDSGTLAIFFETDIHAGGLDMPDFEYPQPRQPPHQATPKIVSKSVVKVPKSLIKHKL
ncbi:YhcH/YjgK/YiaL family protein [Helicobacter sp. 11S02596-1]|uniref:YhcH/YjgK/YiaL family protein n=1 Tax=Helicobacter sp. 11S02596-1 TaxID=1476194 RepID=UPI000BA5AE07|nr:YhcH/YjgK/YiaL family protein [Helicobacter sp. 11S02596-1]PAF43958.1 hypothetical protein BJI48_04000 [Helicobacter sp. 11S02596-1]